MPPLHSTHRTPSDIRVIGSALHLLPLRTRLPIKFGHQVVREVTCARVCVRVEDRRGAQAIGWGETPLSVQWAWPRQTDYSRGLERMTALCATLANAWTNYNTERGHPMELGWSFDRDVLPSLIEASNATTADDVPMSYLAAIVCNSAFDLAVHDAFAQLLGLPVYQTYHGDLMNHDLAFYFGDLCDENICFKNKYPADFLVQPPRRIPAWHLVGGMDPLTPDDPVETRPDDGYPVDLVSWVRRDGLLCLKIKLRGNDAGWDMQRMVRVARLVEGTPVRAFSVDFNCTVTDPGYVNQFLDQLQREEPAAWEKLLYVEQPFPYELEDYPLDVRGVSSRKPLLMDESAHHWELVRRGRMLGWTGVALKTCKTQTGALLSLCWAKAHGMTLMVQDLANPMLAIIPHVQLAAHAGTMAGVEVNAVQFYPDASAHEARVHPGLYQRRDGCVDLSTLGGAGFGYRLDRMDRCLPQPFASHGRIDADATQPASQP